MIEYYSIKTQTKPTNQSTKQTQPSKNPKETNSKTPNKPRKKAFSDHETHPFQGTAREYFDLKYGVF